MRSFRDKALILIMCAILGIVLSLQFRVVQGNYLGGRIPSQRLVELKSELKKAQDEKEKLKAERDKYTKNLEEIEKAASEDSTIIKRLNEELEKYKKVSGYTSVKGPGIEVVVDDPPKDLEYSYNNSVIMSNYDYLLMIVNFLNSAGAEAISINDQRIVANTEIQLAGSSLRINSVPTAPPYYIKAIGNADTLKSSLDLRFGIVERMRSDWNLQVDIKEFDEIIIERYNGIINYKYLRSVDEK